MQPAARESDAPDDTDYDRERYVNGDIPPELCAPDTAVEIDIMFRNRIGEILPELVEIQLLHRLPPAGIRACCCYAGAQRGRDSEMDTAPEPISRVSAAEIS
jgi:hypothetical protein